MNKESLIQPMVEVNRLQTITDLFYKAVNKQYLHPAALEENIHSYKAMCRHSINNNANSEGMVRSLVNMRNVMDRTLKVIKPIRDLCDAMSKTNTSEKCLLLCCCMCVVNNPTNYTVDSEMDYVLAEAIKILSKETGKIVNNDNVVKTIIDYFDLLDISNKTKDLLRNARIID